MDAATESANDKNEQIIRDIIDPTPDLFVDDNLNFENQTFRNNNSDKTYTLPKQFNKRLDDILKENCPPEIFEPKSVKKIPNNSINIQESDDIFINDDTVVLMFEPQIDFPQTSADTRDDFKINPDKEDAIIFKSPTLIDVKTKKSRFAPYRITREQIRDALSTAFDDLETFDYNNNTNVEDLTDDLNHIDRLEKINKIKDFVKGLDTKTREEIGKNLNVDKWLGNLINERLIVPNQSLSMIPKEDTSRSDDVTFLKKVPLRRERSVRKLVKREFPINDNDNDIDLIRYVSPTRKCKQSKQENNKNKRQIIENEVEFVKKMLSHPIYIFKRRKIKSELKKKKK